MADLSRLTLAQLNELATVLAALHAAGGQITLHSGLEPRFDLTPGRQPQLVFDYVMPDIRVDTASGDEKAVFVRADFIAAMADRNAELSAPEHWPENNETEATPAADDSLVGGAFFHLGTLIYPHGGFTMLDDREIFRASDLSMPIGDLARELGKTVPQVKARLEILTRCHTLKMAELSDAFKRIHPEH